MDRFSFRAAVHIAQAEFRQWLRSSRIIILFVMLVFVNVQVIGPLRQCKMLMGEMLSIPEAFVALGNSGVILLIIPILFLVLMADFPQRTGIDRFYQMRCTKRTWIFGQAVCGSGILFCAFIPFGVIVRSYDRDRQMESFIF